MVAGTVAGSLLGPAGALAGGAAMGAVGNAAEAGIADNHILDPDVCHGCARYTSPASMS